MLTDRSRKARPLSALALCSSLAIATALVMGASSARAQSFQGNGTFNSGSGTITPTAGSTTINITSSDAVIDWTTFDTAIGGGPINFQPTGTTATFQRVGQDFSVLNRIFPTDPSRAIQFNGTVIGQIQSTTSVPGGSVYFYSPGGVIVGSTAVFNVGNLGLTSIAPAVVGGVFEQTGPNGEFVQFNGAVTAGSKVKIDPGAQITSTGANGSYVALVAPFIDNAGSISVNGVAALVSADAATITFNPTGLFDIQVTSGTSGGVGGTALFNDGTITGPAYTGAGPVHRIYAVAVPKNTAMTLAIGAGSALGFDIAGAADVVGNAVVLSAGYDIVGGQAAATRSPGGGSGQAGILIGAANVTSALTARSTGNTFVFTNAGETGSFASDLSIAGATGNLFGNPNAVQVRALGNGSSLSVAGNLTVTALDPTLVAPGSGFAVSQFAAVDVDSGATLNVSGSLAVTNSINSGATSGVTNARLSVTDGASATIGGPVTITANRNTSVQGGAAMGGSAAIRVSNLGSVSIGGAATLDANGFGGISNTSGVDGGNGTGGQAELGTFDGGSIAVGGALLIRANGSAGPADATPANGGIGTGGIAQIYHDRAGTITLNGGVQLEAQGSGGAAMQGTGGAGVGGQARAILYNTLGGTASGSLSVTGPLTALANGFGGTGSGGSGGNAFGGTARLAADTGGQTINVLGETRLVANAFAGSGAGGAGGEARGGNAEIRAIDGSSIMVGSVLRLRSDGFGSGSGFGYGGTSNVNASTGGDISANELNVTAEGRGGNDSGAGAGGGIGGVAGIGASGSGSTISIANGNTLGVPANNDLFFMAARGFGGQTNGGGSGVGGIGTGGNAAINVTNGATLTGPANVGTQGFVGIFVRGFGGDANAANTTGGSAGGGTINITVDNATMTSADLVPSAFAMGGSATAAAVAGGLTVTGGNAVGGTRNITVNNGGSLTTSFGGGGAGANGGNASGSGRGGDAGGGSANLTVDNGSTLSLTASSSVMAPTTGGFGGAGGMSGNAIGGSAFVRVANGSTLSMAGPATNALSVSADAFASLSPAPGSASGSNSTGGPATFEIDNATANLQTLNITATGTGGGGFVGQGGTGTGGTAILRLIGATFNADSVRVDAAGSGGSLDVGQNGTGGLGTGGTARLAAIGGTSTATIAQFIEIAGDGLGGNIGGGPGATNTGSAVGGLAQLLVNGGASLTLNVPEIGLVADGEGGEAFGSGVVAGGDGTGGAAQVIVNGGNLTVNGDLFLEADNDGGEGMIGGDGLLRADGAPNAILQAQNGSITVTGLTQLTSEGDGGDGSGAGNGGSGAGGYALVVANNGNGTTGAGTISLADLVIDTSADGGSASGTGNGGDAGAGRSHLFANGGSITITGNADIVADAFAGDGVNGGDAISARADFDPRALIGAFSGTIDIAGSTFLTASAVGGDGRLGGTGGIAFAGQAAVDAQSNNGPSAISLVDLTIEAFALGGFGGDGDFGLPGGAGGDAYGGPISAHGNAGRGVLTVSGDTAIFATAVGGDGGFGGADEIGTGGAGGAGGRAFGGSISVGTRSGANTPENVGSATFGQVSGDANAFGGSGGDGGSAPTQGVGGAGGVAFGGSAGILVRGSPATFGDVSFTAVGVGGDGGLGSVQGDGGDGYAGDGFVIATQRFNRTERGSLTAGNVSIVSAGLGGAGVTAGDSFFSAAQGSEGEFFVRQADATIGNLSLSTSGALAPDVTLSILSAVDPDTGLFTEDGVPFLQSVTVTAEPFDLNLADGTVNVAGGFSLFTPGEMRVVLSSSTLNTTNLTLAAGNFVLPATPPATFGTINVGNSLSISSGLDFLAYANFAGNGDGFFVADGDVLTGDLVFGGVLDIDALGSITTGNIQAGDVGLDAGQNLATGAVVAGENIDLVAAGTATTGQLDAGDTAGVSAGGAVNVAGASAGIVSQSTNPDADYVVVLRSLTSIDAGNLNALGSIGVGSPGTIAVGNVTSGVQGLGFLALAGTGLTTGAIDTTASPSGGVVYLANFSMESLGGELGSEFDPAPVLAATPVAIGGPVTLGGTVATGKFQAATTAALIAQDITASQPLELIADGSITIGNVQASDISLFSGQSIATGTLSSGSDIDAEAAGTLTTGAITTAGLVEMLAAGSLTTGAINAGQSVSLEATGGSILAGNIVAGNDPITQFSIGLIAGGNVSVGNLTAANAIGILAGTGAINAGTVSTPTSLLALTRGGANFGNVTTGTGAGNFLYVADSSMAALGGPLDDNFNPAPIFAAIPVATSGAINLGAVNGGNVVAATTQGLNAGTITARNADLTSGLALVTGAVTAALDIDLDSTSSITTGALQAGDTIGVEAIGGVNVASASAGLVNPSTDPAAEFNVGLRSQTSITAGALSARANIGLASPGTISVGNLSAGPAVLALAGTGLTTGSITTVSGGRVYLGNASLEALGGQITNTFNPAPVLAAGTLPIAGPITINGPVTTGVVQAAATGSIAAGAFTTNFATALFSNAGSVSAGAIQAGDNVLIGGAAGVTLGNVSAGIVNPSISPAATYQISVASGSGGITTGTLTARRDIGLQAAGSIAAGNIAGRDVLLLAGSGVSTGSIQALVGAQPIGRVYIGNFSMATSSANVFSPFNTLGTLFNTNPVRTGGPITLGGAVNAGSLFAATAQGVSLQAVTANLTSTGAFGDIDIDAGGLATINGRLAAGNRIDIASGDIDIAATGSLDALSSAGEIQLASNNPNGAFIGDGVSGNGYALSSAEFGRLKAGEIAIVGDDLAGTVDMTIGNLSISASQLYGSGDTVLFATGNRATQTPSGLLRINGAVTATGFDSNTSLEFLGGTFELNAATGSVKVSNGSGVLGGFVSIEADRIHVAQDSILVKLRADPLYNGHIQELNAPAATPRPDGVLNALALDLEGNETIFIQNTGTAQVPAGFLTTIGDDTDIGSESPPTGGTKIVINGQIQTSTGTVTGKAAFDLVIAQAKADATAEGEMFASDLAPNSTFNGCVILTEVCGLGQMDPVAAISNEIALVTNSTLDDSPVAPAAEDADEGEGGGSEQDDEDADSDEGASPIAPPTPLISTRALDGTVDVVEPVSGAGNPALFGSAVSETAASSENTQGDDK